MYADDASLIDSLRSYVAFVIDTASGFMQSNQLNPAEKILTGCQKCLQTQIPPQFVYAEGFLF